MAGRFVDLFLQETAKLKVGDPSDQDTVVGPLIDWKACDRVMQWIAEARRRAQNCWRAAKTPGEFHPSGSLF